ncbi:MAG: helix-turn-helix transcriptional regulator [Eggerthellaceae bacterium]|nr:helix-turn-helix transcriptional regulator [Eggerthellaceae bacterium]
MRFYEAFEIALKEKGLKAADICSATGIHSSYFSKLKSGHTKDVTWEKALLIINALGMTPDEFYALQTQEVDR